MPTIEDTTTWQALRLREAAESVSNGFPALPRLDDVDSLRQHFNEAATELDEIAADVQAVEDVYLGNPAKKDAIPFPIEPEYIAALGLIVQETREAIEEFTDYADKLASRLKTLDMARKAQADSDA